MSNSLDAWRRYIFDPGISFREKAESVALHQYTHQPLYRRFCEEIGMQPGSMDDIPLVPIQVFRDAQVRPDYMTEPEAVFRSSGTTETRPGHSSGTRSPVRPNDFSQTAVRSRRSTHEIVDRTLYEESCYRGFSCFYQPEEFAVFAYLPGYTDNPDSSLIAMIDLFVRRDRSGLSRLLPLNRPLQKEDFDLVRSKNRRIMLFGAAFGLLDLLELGVPALPPESVVVETGGMKTRRREIPKQKLHKRLAEGFSVPPSAVHSEYGMAEMCSQAWDAGDGRFRCPPWLRITIRDAENPMALQPAGTEGLIGVTDLANVHSISFFLTQDRGVAWPDGSFQILGRWDHAQLRGCNFLME